LDLANQITVAEAIVEAATLRTESRGAHYRSDFPDRDDAQWLEYIVLRTADDGSLDSTRHPVEFTRRPPGSAQMGGAA
jgi:fumarate reductase flavoprotein subunit